jgi:hypothetical protein
MTVRSTENEGYMSAGVQRGRKHNFSIGDRVIGKDSAPADFRKHTGTIREIGPGKGEYGVYIDQHEGD